MTSVFECPKCLKRFKSKSSLYTHVKTICSDNPEIFSCEFCSITFTRKSNLKSHLEHCSVKKQQQSLSISQLLNQKTSECEGLKTLLNTKDEEIKAKDDALKAKDDALKAQIEKMKAIHLAVVSEKDKKIAVLKARLKDLKKSNEKLDDKFTKTVDKAINKASVNITTNNQTFNNLIVDHLQPITDDLMREISEKISIMAIKSGVTGIANALKPLLEDKIIRTDESRNTLAYNYKGVPKKDPKGVSLSTQIIESTAKNFEQYKDEIIRYYDNKNEKGELVGTELDNSISFGMYRKNMNAKRFGSEGKKLAKRIAKFAMSKLEFDLKHGLTKTQEQKPDGLQLSDIPPGCQNYTYGGRDYTVLRYPTGEVRRLMRLKSNGEIMESDEDSDDFSNEDSEDFSDEDSGDEY